MFADTPYEYSGYLKSLLHKPDRALRGTLSCVEFTADDLANWNLLDDEADLEWQHVPAAVERTDEGVLLRGYFEDVRRIDNLDRDDPSFWVPLSSRGWEDDRFPVDVQKYPIVEVTYRCSTGRARPAWQWDYPGGVHFDGLQPTRTWRCIARRVPHFGFPKRIDGLTFRLYSTWRSAEALEIHSVRFRAASPDEAEACDKHYALLSAAEKPKRYPVLDEFFPIGVTMKAGSAKRLAETMDISFRDYWRLALEDIARHFHNCVALEEVEELSGSEWLELLDIAAGYGIRCVAMYDWAMDDFEAHGREWVDRYVRPYADSPAVLAWCAQNEPPQHAFGAHLQARKLIEEADPNHPMVTMMREPSSLSLFAPFFPISGLSFLKSHTPSEIGPLIKEHLHLCGGQQMWLQAPAFVYGTDTPEWNTCPEMRLMLNLALANGVRGWFAFTYHNDPIWLDGHCQRSLTGPFLTFSDLWSELGHRVERVSALTPLLLCSAPDPAPKAIIDVRWERHPRSKCPEGMEPIHPYWLRNSDFRLLYVVSRDIGEVTPVYMDVPESLPHGQEVFDLTNFARTRRWAPVERQRHIEMFPGQGQVIIIAAPEVCEYWRRVISRRILESDRRIIAIDLELAGQYKVDVADVIRGIPEEDGEPGMEELAQMRAARDCLLNAIYRSPALITSRSKLIQASAGICACDGTLCRLLGKGKVDPAHEYGLRVLPLTRELAQLRLQLRSGRGPEIERECEELAARILRLLAEIRALS